MFCVVSHKNQFFSGMKLVSRSKKLNSPPMDGLAMVEVVGEFTGQRMGPTYF